MTSPDSGGTLGPEFRSLLSAAFITNIGDGMRLAAMPLLAISLTDSPLYISALTASQYLPWIVWAPFGGVIVDRADRRRLILITQAWRALLMLALGLAVLADAAAMWQLIVVAFLITAGEILVDPSVVATVPQVVGADDLDRANGQLNSVEMATNEFFGKTVGAVIYGFTPWLPFVIDAATYGGSNVPFSRLPRTERPASPRERNLRQEIGAGLSWIRHHRFIGPLTGSVALFHLGTGGALAMLAILVDRVLDQPAWVFGAVLALAGLGAAVTSPLAAGMAVRTSRRTVMTVASAGVAISTIAVAAGESAWHVMALWAVNGAAFGLFHSVGRGFIQRHAPDELLGRVAIASRTISRGAFAVGALAIGTIAEATSVRTGMLTAGVLHAIGAFLIWLAFRHEPQPV
ncbi:MAG: MFS transporter [Actinomycetota bacterium]